MELAEGSLDKLMREGANIRGLEQNVLTDLTMDCCESAYIHRGGGQAELGAALLAGEQDCLEHYEDFRLGDEVPEKEQRGPPGHQAPEHPRLPW